MMINIDSAPFKTSDLILISAPSKTFHCRRNSKNFN